MPYKVALPSSQFTGHGLPFVRAAKTLSISFIFLPTDRSCSLAYLILCSGSIMKVPLYAIPDSSSKIPKLLDKDFV